MFYIKIPHERVPVLIGKNGDIKAMIEEKTGIRMAVDSDSGEVQLITENEAGESCVDDPLLSLKARDIVTAIGRGFPPQKALRILKDDVFFELFDIRDYVGKNVDKVRRVRGRIIGTNGRTRELLEEFTGADISVYGNTVGIICDVEQMATAKNAVDMLLQGSKQANVYRFLEKKRHDDALSRFQ